MPLLSDSPFPELRRPQPAPIEPLSPQEQESMLSKVSSAGLHGLGWIGGTLSKTFGGRAIRAGLGMATGRDMPASELLSFIPFSDTFNLTDPANEVRGTQLLGGDHDSSFFSPEGIGGLGIDILSDPATYMLLGGSTLTPLGRAAQKANVLPSTITSRLAGLSAASPEAATLAATVGGGATPASVAGQRLGAHLGFRIPFTGLGTTFDLSPLGSFANAIPGVSGALAMGSELGSPLYRGFNALFRHGAKGQLEPVLQDVAFEGTEKFMPRYKDLLDKPAEWALARQAAAGHQFGQEWTAAHAAVTKSDAPILREMMELTLDPGQALSPARQQAYSARLAQLQQQYPHLSPIVNEWQTARQGYLGDLQKWGYGTEAPAGVGFAPRQISTLEGAGSGGRSIAPGSGPMRKEMFDSMLTEGPLGSINELTRDLALRQAANPGLKAQDILARYLGNDPALLNQAKELASWHGGLDFKTIDRLGGYFVNDPIADITHYMSKLAGRGINAEGAYEAVARMGAPMAPGMTPVSSLINSTSPLQFVRTPEALAQLTSAWQKANPGAPAGAFTAWLNQSGITGKQLQGLTRMVAPATAPAGAGPWLGVLDSILNLTKAGQTSWPATVLRNFTSDLFKRFSGGGSLSGTLSLEPLMAAKALHDGQTYAGIAASIPRLAHLSDEAATQQLLKEAWQLQLADSMRMQTPNVAGLAPGSAIAREMPTIGIPQQGLLSQLGERIPGAADLNLLSPDSKLNPFNIRGFGGKTETANAWVGGHQDVSRYLEELNRLATYVDSARRGYNPVAGMQNVITAHHDFSKLSDFEQNFMRRVIPYYGWLRANAPQAIGEIATNPGGRMAQTMRVMTNAGGRGQYLPETLTNTGLSIPVPGGPDEEGRQRYLTSLGLPFEDLAQLTSLGNMIGSTAPYIRGPAELALGKQFYSGRDVPTNFPTELGGTVNQLAMLSPLSRVFSTARAIGQQDPLGAAAQTLLGPRLTQVNQEAARNQAIRETVESQLSNLPEVSRFSRLYVPPEQMQNLSPDELLLLRLHTTLERERSALARQRRAGM